MFYTSPFPRTVFVYRGTRIHPKRRWLTSVFQMPKLVRGFVHIGVYTVAGEFGVGIQNGATCSIGCVLFVCEV